MWSLHAEFTSGVNVSVNGCLLLYVSPTLAQIGSCDPPPGLLRDKAVGDEQIDIIYVPAYDALNPRIIFQYNTVVSAIVNGMSTNMLVTPAGALSKGSIDATVWQQT